MSGQTDTIDEIDQQLDNLGSAVKTHNALIGNAPLALIWGSLYLICKCLIEIARKMERGG
jgi:hypothetical protein